VLILIIAIVVFFVAFMVDFSKQGNSNSSTDRSPKIESQKPMAFKIPKKGLYTFMGQTQESVMNQIGEPERIDPTAYGYQWWIYGQGTPKYFQIGMENNKVVTVLALGKALPTAPFKIGEDAPDIYKKVTPSDNVTLTYKKTKVEFELAEDELMVEPLIKLGDQWVQLYFDHFTNKLIGVRYWTSDLLIKQKPYTLVYQGHLDHPPEPSEQEWQNIDQAEQQEILDITNVFRMNNHLKPLDSNDSADQAAYFHSKEMNDKDYFSHDSKWQGSLSDRLQKQKIAFRVAGENIAWNYTDGISAVVGWINSEGHRKNLLDKRFTELGVGVYKKYYTQDFVQAL